jgi:hypothetical protein
VSDNPVLRLRLSPGDYQRLIRLASASGLSLSQMLRELIRSASK